MGVWVGERNEPNQEINLAGSLNLKFNKIEIGYNKIISQVLFCGASFSFFCPRLLGKGLAEPLLKVISLLQKASAPFAQERAAVHLCQGCLPHSLQLPHVLSCKGSPLNLSPSFFLGPPYWLQWLSWRPSREWQTWPPTPEVRRCMELWGGKMGLEGEFC